ncbi:hypothetical protein QFC21_002078 [Naganishia friedmannii]|uniref:Uncharacterized protein n=1 Tax=Naganishia friedmannii TaxID=89922 RepID=A0ACC2W0C5_9TREE|nr:hypothetical protein QFC21_002078 [Naganishia friedmannii]
MSKLRGLPQDEPDVRFSKTLAYLLRHGAEKHGLPMRKDGFVRVSDLLQEPTLKPLSFPQLHNLVESNNKRRFVLFYGVDPTPNRPERKSKQQQGKKNKAQPQQVKILQPETEEKEQGEDESPLVPLEPPPIPLFTTANAPTSLKGTPSPRSATDETNVSSPPEAEWFIRAAQGHSIQTVTTEHLEPVLQADEEGLSKVGEMVHGTKSESWDSIRPRANSTLYIHLSLPTLLSHDPPIPVFVSTNNVVLTPGNSQGIIPPSMFEKVVRLRRELLDRAVPPAAPEQGQQELELELGAAAAVAQPVLEGQEPAAKPKRDRKNREKQPRPKFTEEVIWEHGVAVDPPRTVGVPDLR